MGNDFLKGFIIGDITATIVSIVTYHICKKVRQKRNEDVSEGIEEVATERASDIWEGLDNVNVVDDEIKKTWATNTEKPSLASMYNDYLVDKYAYRSAALDDQADGVEEQLGDDKEVKYIIKAEDFVRTWDQYEHITCTYYPDEEVMVNLDNDFEIIKSIVGAIGTIGYSAVMRDEWVDEAIYVVNHEQEACYEILKADAPYQQDLDEWIEANGD